tara:strand:- start:606 stop:1436 length:831 start_codon:yes stop_codon:yes gene_type:complete
MNKRPTSLEKYLFDLNGYIVIKNALGKKEIKDCNKIIDNIKKTPHDTWHGYVHSKGYIGADGMLLQQIYEAGKCFEKLIDHPSWINHLIEFVGGKNTFDHLHGPLFIDENFVNIRGPGEAVKVHSGNHEGTQRGHYRYENGKFHCGQINILVALNNINQGDGGTVIIPGSHKSNIKHPELDKFHKENNGSFKTADGMTGAEEIFLNSGDALLFVDSLCHGSARRINNGERRVAIYRYGPSWGFFRNGYRPSKELLSRLSKFQRQIVMPHDNILKPS